MNLLYLILVRLKEVSSTYMGISIFCFSHFCLGFPLPGPGFSVVGKLLSETQEYYGACPWWGRVDGSLFVGNEMCRELNFSFNSHTPSDPCISHNCYPQISPVPVHVPYFPKLLLVYIFSTLLGVACPSTIQGLVIVFYFDVP